MQMTSGRKIWIVRLAVLPYVYWILSNLLLYFQNHLVLADILANIGIALVLAIGVWLLKEWARKISIFINLLAWALLVFRDLFVILQRGMYSRFFEVSALIVMCLGATALLHFNRSIFATM